MWRQRYFPGDISVVLLMLHKFKTVGISPQDPVWWMTHTPKYCFPAKTNGYGDFGATSFVLMAATLGNLRVLLVSLRIRVTYLHLIRCSFVYRQHFGFALSDVVLFATDAGTSNSTEFHSIANK